MSIRLIVAMDKNNVIGVNGTMPWHSKEEFKHFVSLTKNKCIIMGRNTLESLPAPLKGRLMICVTSNPLNTVFHDDYIIFYVNSLQKAIKLGKQLRLNEDIYIAGGSQIYQQALNDNLVDIIDLSIMNNAVVFNDTDVVTKFQFSIDEWEISHITEYNDFSYNYLIRN